MSLHSCACKQDAAPSNKVTVGIVLFTKGFPVVGIHLFCSYFGIAFPYFCMSSSHCPKQTKAEQVGAHFNRYPDITASNGMGQMAVWFDSEAMFWPKRMQTEGERTIIFVPNHEKNGKLLLQCIDNGFLLNDWKVYRAYSLGLSLTKKKTISKKFGR